MSTPRETQFATFAKLLLKEMIEEEFGQLNVNALATGSIADLEQLIAKRAYDLSQHTVGYTLEYLYECGMRTPGSMNLSIQPSIPDMTTLPEVSE